MSETRRVIDPVEARRLAAFVVALNDVEKKFSLRLDLPDDGVPIVDADESVAPFVVTRAVDGDPLGLGVAP